MKPGVDAPLGPKGTELMVTRVLREGWTVKQAACAAGVSERTAGKRWPAGAPTARSTSPPVRSRDCQLGPARSVPTDAGSRSIPALGVPADSCGASSVACL